MEEILVRIEEGTARLLHSASALDESDLLAPSLLPGWTRAHVLSHVARNAWALVNVLTSALTGEERPMYASPEAREAGIAEGAQGGTHQLVGEVMESAALFSDAARALHDEQWAAEVLFMGERRGPAGMALTGRLREVEFHHVDLDAGYTAAHWDPAFVAAQLDQAAAALAGRPGVPELVLVSTDRDVPPAAAPAVLAGRAHAPSELALARGPVDAPPHEWHVDGYGPEITVSGASAALLAWMCGRSDGDGLAATDGVLPVLPAWP